MRIGIFGSDCKEDKLHVIKGLFYKLKTLNAEVYIQPSFQSFLEQTFGFEPETDGIVENNYYTLDIVLSVGGDGTFLRTAMLVNEYDIPILGINTGRLGFLAESGSTQIDDTLDELFRGEFYVEERSMLQLRSDKGDDFSGFDLALNDIAIMKRDNSSMITIHTYLNGDYFTSYRADGLVVATPTGSTAYSMSINGPLLLPQNHNFILNPVAPHSLTVRPIIVPDDTKIMLNVESRSNSFLIASDGRSKDCSTGKMLIISKSKNTTRIVKRFNHTFYQTLREKLMWGRDARS